jgi:hypothetical protein
MTEMFVIAAVVYAVVSVIAATIIMLWPIV